MSLKLLSVAEVCEILRTSRPTVHQWLHAEDPDERLPSLRIGIRIWIREDEFLAWLDRHSTSGKASIRQTKRRAGA